MKLQIGALVLAGACLAGCGASPVMATYEGADIVETFMQEDYTRFYRIYVPERTTLAPAAPLVLAFHGVGQNGDQFRAMSGLDRAADSAGFIVVYAEAAMGAWDVFGDLGFLGLDELGYVREIIDHVTSRFVVDESRIIAVGLSNGGVISQRMACKLSDRIAGFVSVAASMPKKLAEDCSPGRPVSALYILGTVDPFFPAAGNSVLKSFDESVAFWANVNRCEGARTRSAWPDREEDETRAYWSWYRPCRDGSRVSMDSVVGGGHAWPSSAIPAPAQFGATSRDISANAEISRFLDALPGN